MSTIDTSSIHNNTPIRSVETVAKKHTTETTGLSKVANAALTAIKAVGVVFAIVLTAGIILASKNFRRLAAGIFFGKEYLLNKDFKVAKVNHKETHETFKAAKEKLRAAKAELKKASAEELPAAKEKVKAAKEEFTAAKNEVKAANDTIILAKKAKVTKMTASEASNAPSGKITPNDIKNSKVFKVYNKPEVTEEPVVTEEPTTYQKVATKVTEVAKEGVDHVSKNASWYATGLGIAILGFIALGRASRGN